MNMHFLLINTQMKIPRMYVTCERTVQACASLGTLYMPASMRDTQVTRVHADKELHASMFTSQYWRPMVSSWH